MCGIFGKYLSEHSKANLCAGASDRINAMQAHRGPDHGGYKLLNNNRLLLSHQRLSVIDLTDAANQPMTISCACCSSGQQLWMTYNGEIYNYHELRRRLESAGHTFFSQSDSEVILHLYGELGVDAFSQLNGIFSLAIYDDRDSVRGDIENRDLIVVRDAIGVKPLYYSQSADFFTFASELKTLLLDYNVSREINYSALNQYLTYLWAPAPDTALKSVSKLEPGCYLQIRDGRIIKQQRYYEIPVAHDVGLLKPDENHLIEETRCLVERSVKRQIVSDVPIGAFLSGGLDSSAIVSCMSQMKEGEGVDCYTVRFSDNEVIGGAVEDYPYAQQVSKYLGARLHTVTVSPEAYQLLPKMIYHLDEPQADIAPINAYLIAQRAREHGCKVLMSGAGGDDIFTGYRRHYALSCEKYWQWMPLATRRFLSSIARTQVKKGLRLSHHPTIRRLLKLVSRCDQVGFQRIASYFEWSQSQLRKTLFLHPEFYDTTNASFLASALSALSQANPGISPIDQMLYLECKHFLPDHNLNYTDKMTMAHGIETRVPLLDLELVKHAFSLPVRLKQRGKVGKYIFKRSMEAYLPKEVIYRSKTGFGVPLRKWLHMGMKPAIDELLGKTSVEARGIFNYKTIAALLEQDRSGRVDASYIILALFNIELWFRTFVDPKVPTVQSIW